MGNLSDILDQKYIPSQAIIIYKNENEYYLESHPIVEGKMGAGSPLSEDIIIDIADSFSTKSRAVIYNKGLLPENVLQFDNRNGFNNITWYRLPEQRQIFFSKALNISTGIMWVPGLIYQLKNDSISVHAFKGNKLPKANTKLFRAPFFNIYQDNSVCMGNAKVRKPSHLTLENIIKYWEDKFWLSEFSHVNNNPIKGNLSSLTKALISSGEKFPENELLPINKTLEEVVS